MGIALVERHDDVRLPVYLTRFFGRDDELAKLALLLGDPDERMITLAGTGGVGKTRLLIEAIRRVDAGDLLYVDGVALAQPDLLLPEIVQLLGLDRLAERSSGEVLSEHLAGRRLMLVIDNMEHLLGAAVELSALLHALPGLRIVTTSRAPLHISGEYLMPVGPLATVAERNDQAELSVAAQVFLDRSARTGRMIAPDQGDIAVIESICARLDGLPLAIELAAARTRVLSLPALLAVLTHQLAVLTGGPIDVSERHRTLRAAIDWSFELLDPAERRLLRDLSVFADTFSLESVVEIATEQDRDPLDLLDVLFDQALLVRLDDDGRGQPRFRLLVSIREFGLEQLQESGEEETLRRRHAEYFLRQAEQREPSLMGSGQAEAVQWLSAEIANLRQALEYLIEQGHQTAALRMVAALYRFWLIRVQWDEARIAFQRVFAMEAPQTSVVWGAALRGAAEVAESQCDWDAALVWNRQAIAIWKELGEQSWEARSRIDLGNIHAGLGQFEEARGEYARAVEAIDAATDPRTRLIAIGSSSIADLRQGHLEDAERGFEALIPEIRKLDDPWLLSTCLSNLGIVKQRLHQTPAARASFEESLAIRRGLGDDYGVGVALVNLADVQEDPADELAVSLEALAIAQRLGALEMIAAARVNIGACEFDRDDRAAAAADYIEGLDAYFDRGDEVQMTDALSLIAELVETSDPQCAVRLLGAVHAIHAAHDIVATGPIAVRASAVGTRLRDRLDMDIFERELQHGRTLSLVDARLDAIQAARVAGSIAPPPLVMERKNADVATGLTARELEVLRLIAAGKTDREIAEQLFITPKTANHHVTHIFAKLECRNRASAAAMAIRMGLADAV